MNRTKTLGPRRRPHRAVRLSTAVTTWWVAVLGLIVVMGGPVFGTPGDVARVSVASDGSEGDLDSLSWGGAVSADGRLVTFVSRASNLVPGDTNGEPDVFVHDLDAGTTRRVSVSSAGNQGNGNSSLLEGSLPRISADGRRVVFVSEASNLVGGDANGALDVFVHDLDSSTTTRVSVSSAGDEGDASALFSSISADGRYVSFTSEASNLVTGDTNALPDVFVHDLQTGQTNRVSVSSTGIESNGESLLTVISGTGRYIGFLSEASNLVPGDTNAIADGFVHDRQTGETERVTVASNGTQANDSSHIAALSAEGRFVMFNSHATNLVGGDTNGVSDVFVHDRQTGSTTRVSVDDIGAEADAASLGTDMSADGRYVVFDSTATNLVGGDSNGFKDVFLHDRQNGDTKRVSAAGGGSESDRDSAYPAISTDGAYIVFSSTATNLVAGDSNGFSDVFIYQYQVPQPPTTSTTSTTLTTPPTPAAGDYFVDDDGHQFEAAIDWLYVAGITSGCNPPVNDRFCPDDHVSRDQMAAFLVRALGYTDDGGGDHFSDDDGRVLERAIDRLYTAGVTVGCNPPDNDRFCPDSFVTRGQMAAFLVRAFGFTEDGGGDLFDDDDTTVFERAIDRLGTAGVTVGCNPPENDSFCPEDLVTRGQMAAFIKRALQERQ